MLHVMALPYVQMSRMVKGNDSKGEECAFLPFWELRLLSQGQCGGAEIPGRV
jgi:hypothetical protein